MTKIVNLQGRRFGRLVVVSLDAERHGASRKVYWNCACDCGKQKAIAAHALISGKARTCGCSRFKGGGWKTKEYTAWRHMRQRCINPKNAGYTNYGGRGIKVCERWEKFANFLADMGKAPSKAHSIDRIDNDGNYEPSNCRWATTAEQNLNRSVTFYIEIDGKKIPLLSFCREKGLSFSLLQQRLKAGWPLQEAITLKSRRHKPQITKPIQP